MLLLGCESTESVISYAAIVPLPARFLAAAGSQVHFGGSAMNPRVFGLALSIREMTDGRCSGKYPNDGAEGHGMAPPMEYGEDRNAPAQGGHERCATHAGAGALASLEHGS